MSSFAAPASNPMGQSLGADDIELQNPAHPKVDVVATLTDALETIKQHPAEAIGGAMAIMFVTVIVNVILALIQGVIVGILSAAVSQTGSETAMYGVMAIQVGLQLISTIILVVIQGVLTGGYYIMWLRMVRGEEVSFNNFMDVKPFILPLVLTTLLVQLCIFGGMLMLIVPGIIISLGIWVAPMVVLDKNLSPVNAIKGAWRITDGYKMDIFLLGILMTVVNFIGMIPCFLGLIITIPLSLGAMVSFYNQIAVPGRAYAEGEQLLHAFE
jgi:uncharacterized membrane protein